MIIGNGMMAKAMKDLDQKDLLIFASGVSNSLEVDKKKYEREYNLLCENIEKYPDKKLIYFSTASIYDESKSNSEYVKFKRKIEQLIKSTVSNYIIFRVGNVIAKGGNTNSLINFLKNSIESRYEFDLYFDATRFFVDIDDVFLFVKLNHNRFHNEIVDLYYPYAYSVLEVLNVIEELFEKKANYRLIRSNSRYTQDIPEYLTIFFNTITPKQYIYNALKKNVL